METSPSQSQNKTQTPTGSLAVVGIGPGSPEMLTIAAEKAIKNADIVIGNDFYINQIPHLFTHQEVIKSQMGKEVNRAKQAIALAQDKHVVMVSGGDPGVYGMAGLILEMAERIAPDLKIDIIPGVTAASAGAALLGAPLTNDFAVISLSDLLTPRDVIKKRIRALCTAGIPIVLYNPKSRTRTSLFEDVVDIAREHLAGETPVGIVKDAYRPDETIIVTTLANVMDVFDSVDMHTVVFIGGEETRMLRRYADARGMFTPAGTTGNMSTNTYTDIGADTPEGYAISRTSRELARKTIGDAGPLDRIRQRCSIAVGDFAMADLMRFQGDPVSAGFAALRAGAPIFTDIRMVQTGIQKKGHKSKVTCILDTLSSPDTGGKTRTSAAIMALGDHLTGSIIVIGNAPSALLVLCDMIQKGIRPALIIGTPVGFVNAAESKELLRTFDISSISNEGTRGGTPVAVAAMNEIITMFVEAAGTIE